MASTSRGSQERCSASIQMPSYWKCAARAGKEAMGLPVEQMRATFPARNFARTLDFLMVNGIGKIKKLAVAGGLEENQEKAAEENKAGRTHEEPAQVDMFLFEHTAQVRGNAADAAAEEIEKAIA